MRRSLQKAGVWALAGLFGCISLFGSGWHALVPHSHAGCDHGSSAFHVHAGTHAWPQHACAGHPTCQEPAAAHDPITARRQAQSRVADLRHRAPRRDVAKSRVPAPVFAPIGHDPNCAICSFFAQAQWAVPAELPLAQTGVTAVFSLKTPAFHAEFVGLYRSRAPPLGTLAS